MRMPIQGCVRSSTSSWTLAQLDRDLVAGSSGSFSWSSLTTLRADDKAVTLKSHFSVTGSKAEYPDTIDGDYSDFGEAYGTHRR